MVTFNSPAGDRFVALSDTGGGGSILSRAAADRLSLQPIDTPAEVRAELGPEAQLALPPVLTADTPALPGPVLIVPQAGPVPGWPEAIDGVVGHDWFAGRRWTWDYAAGTLSLDCPTEGEALQIDLPPPHAGPPFKAFPRITVVIAGEPVAMLFDTGASTWLTPSALDVLNDGGPQVRAASMATASRIERWRADHPEWRVIENAQHATGARMIEVRDITVAGRPVGPVWFTERPDRAFTEMMSSMMAGPVEGAVGGNAFTGLRITVDYPGQTGWVSHP